MTSPNTRSLPLRHGLFLAVGAALAQPALAEDAAVTTQLDAVTVQGEYIPEPMAQTAEVASFVSREDLQRTGDGDAAQALARVSGLRSEEHTSELQSRENLVCRLLLEKTNPRATPTRGG